MRVIRLGTFPFSLPQAKIRGVTSAVSRRMGVQRSVFSKQIHNQNKYMYNLCTWQILMTRREKFIRV